MAGARPTTGSPSSTIATSSRDPSVLPVFNSSAIITQLHHIDGLSEHYLYLNDDMFFGRDTRPEDFWFGSGIAKVFPSRVAREFGPRASPATPRTSTSARTSARSWNASSDARSPTPCGTRRTRRSAACWPRSRSGTRRSSTAPPGSGSAITTTSPWTSSSTTTHRRSARPCPHSLPYEYVNVGSTASLARLRRLLATRDYQVFCLNDAPTPGNEELAAAEIDAFLDAYFPMPPASRSLSRTSALAAGDHAVQLRVLALVRREPVALLLEQRREPVAARAASGRRPGRSGSGGSGCRAPSRSRRPCRCGTPRRSSHPAARPR